jgi:hypothetical protein
VPRPQTQPLDFAELFVGDPVDLVQLRGEDENYPVHIWWDIVPTEANTLICRYRGTNAVLQAALPLGTTRCDIRRLNARGEPIRGRTLPPGARTEVTCR